MLPDVVLIAGKVAQVFDDLKIPYLISGSLASSIHGVPRSTRNVDFVAALNPEHVAPFVAALESEFYVDAGTIERAIPLHRSFNVIHFETAFKADIFVAVSDAWTQEQFRQRSYCQLVTDADSPLAWVCGAEDLLLQKLRWFEKGGRISDQQWKDVQGVLRVKAESLDYDYLHQWAAKLELTELLNQALADAGIEIQHNDTTEKERKTNDQET